MDVVRFSSDDLVFTRAEERCAIEASHIASLLPDADIQHVGGTAVRGCRTKGDLDIQVRVSAHELAAASDVLASRYDADQDNPPGDGRVSFRADGEPPVGVQLTAVASPEDKFWRMRDVLLACPDLRLALDDLKADHEGGSMARYRYAKSAFFATLEASPQYQALVTGQPRD